MNRLSIRGKLLLSIGLLAMGYRLFLGLVQWTAAATDHHLTTVSKSIYPAALSMEQAQASFQEQGKDYKEGVLLQDKAALEAADQDAQKVSAQLENVRKKIGYDTAMQAQAEEVLSRFKSLPAREKATYTQMEEHPDSAAADAQASLASLTQDSQAMAGSLTELNDEIGRVYGGAERDRKLECATAAVGIGIVRGGSDRLNCHDRDGGEAGVGSAAGTGSPRTEASMSITGSNAPCDREGKWERTGKDHQGDICSFGADSFGATGDGTSPGGGPVFLILTLHASWPIEVG
jgi:hypothetical protein